MVLPTEPRQLIDFRYDLAMWWESEQGIRFSDTFMQSVRERNERSLPVNPHEMEFEVLTRASAYFVTDEMEKLITGAAEALPGDENVLPFVEMPTQGGMIYLDAPLVTLDVNNDEHRIHLITWWSSPATIELETGENVPGHAIYMGFYSEHPDLQIHYESLAAGMRVPPANPLGGFPISLYHVDLFAMDRPMKYELSDWYKERNILLSKEAFDARTRSIRWVRAFWLITSQRIGSQFRAEPDRAQRRRWGRQDIVPSEIIVVSLRRREPRSEHPEESTPVNWSHRWLVDGHWRRIQDRDRPGQTRLIWVSPYVKGPDDKPLISKHRVYHVKQ